ncbi:sugar diacid recognition domain-containing protein [Escherichia coli]|uniref:sugar diacid recognition domain-containing protein n=1 Tax=Escherichia coli TaxID=562 RepID=UPI000A19CA7C
MHIFDEKLAQSIVSRTMRILDCNVNVMDARGRIIGSGEPERIGDIHEGALLALSQKRVVSIDKASTQSLHCVKPGINLPLRLNDHIVGVIGLTGEPDQLIQFGELVRMTAEMMLEQAGLSQLLVQQSRLREELVLNLVRNNTGPDSLQEWAQRLGINLTQPRVAVVVEIDSGQLGINTAMAELHHLQLLLTEGEQNALIAIVSLTEMVMLWSVNPKSGDWAAEEHRRVMEQLHQHLRQNCTLNVRLALGNFFAGEGGIARSYCTARSTMRVGKRCMPDVFCYYWQDIRLPVLLDGLRDGWQAQELLRPLRCLRMQDPHGVLIKTLHIWFRHNQQMGPTAQALFVHKNTLNYRLKRIAELTGLDLGNYDERFLLYIAVQLDEED